MPEITEVFYPPTRADWRAWLHTHHQTKTEIWLQLFNKASAKPSLAYDDLVEECLCFGWIDGVVKKNLPDGRVQRISPRRERSFLSELNRQRVWKLQRQGLMTDFGLAALGDKLGEPGAPLEIPDWILEQLQADYEVWTNFQAFPYFYRRLKIGWLIEPATSRREEAQRRLNHLLKKTKVNQRYGTEPLADWEE
jgi:uncharacterized protein YdeI (YjbR/CyaY-like superfamily)